MNSDGFFAELGTAVGRTGWGRDQELSMICCRRNITSNLKQLLLPQFLLWVRSWGTAFLCGASGLTRQRSSFGWGWALIGRFHWGGIPSKLLWWCEEFLLVAVGQRPPSVPCLSNMATCFIKKLHQEPAIKESASKTEGTEVPNHGSDIPSPVPHSGVQSQSLGLVYAQGERVTQGVGSQELGSRAV